MPGRAGASALLRGRAGSPSLEHRPDRPNMDLKRLSTPRPNSATVSDPIRDSLTSFRPFMSAGPPLPGIAIGGRPNSAYFPVSNSDVISCRGHSAFGPSRFKRSDETCSSRLLLSTAKMLLCIARPLSLRCKFSRRRFAYGLTSGPGRRQPRSAGGGQIRSRSCRSGSWKTVPRG